MTDPSRGKRAAARRGRHPLLGMFPLAVMSLAAFLVVFTLMMARLSAGADPALRASRNIVVAAAPGRAAVRTRTSAAAASSAPAAAPASAAPAGAVPAVATRTSGVALAGRGDD